MNTDLEQNNNTSLIIMTVMERGFEAVLDQQEIQAKQIFNLQKELKTTTRASYEAHTKEGKDRFLDKLSKDGKTSKEIANLLNIKTVPYVEKRIKQAKRNGK